MKLALSVAGIAVLMVTAIVWGNAVITRPPPPPGYDPREKARDQCIQAHLQQMRAHTDAPYTATWNMCEAMLNLRR